MFAEVLSRGVITHSDNVSCKSEHQVSIPINNSLSHEFSSRTRFHWVLFPRRESKKS